MLIVTGITVLSGLFKPEKTSTKKKPVPLVKTIKVIRGQLSEYIDITGEVVVTKRVTIKTTVTGIVSFCPWREGDKVKSGESLIKINRPLLIAEMQAKKAALAVAQAKYANLKSGARPEEILRARSEVNRFQECSAYTENDLKRNLKLHKKGAVSTESVEKAKVAYVKCRNDLKASIEQLKMLHEGATKTELAVSAAQEKEAEAQYKISKEKVKECQIYAPFSGLITKVFVRKGDLVREGREDVILLEIIDPASIVVKFHIPEQFAGLVNKDTKLSITTGNNKSHPRSSKIIRLYPEIDQTTHTLEVEASISGKNVYPGMFVQVKLPVRSAPEALLIPEAALLTAPDGKNFVYVVENGKAIRRSVLKGLESRGIIQIKEGLAAGEIVISDGNSKLKNNTLVKIKKKPEGKK